MASIESYAKSVGGLVICPPRAYRVYRIGVRDQPPTTTVLVRVDLESTKHWEGICTTGHSRVLTVWRISSTRTTRNLKIHLESGRTRRVLTH